MSVADLLKNEATVLYYKPASTTYKVVIGKKIPDRSNQSGLLWNSHSRLKDNCRKGNLIRIRIAPIDENPQNTTGNQ